MHLRIWCIERLESTVLLSLAMYRSAPLMAFALRQLGATVGNNLQCAHDAYLSGPLDLISIEDDVAIQTGAYIQTTRWSGQFLHVGPVRLESGCKIGMRAAIANDVTVGRGTWITPFTPILGDVGSHEMWEGAPARLSGRCTELKRTANACRYAISGLVVGDPQHSDAGLPVLLAQRGSHRRDSVVRPRLDSGWRRRAFRRIFQGDAAARDRLAPHRLLVHHHLGHRRRDLFAGLPLHPLHGCFAGAVPLARAQGRSPHVQNVSR